MQLRERINVYEEIVEEIKRMIEIGVYKKGDKLPSVRSYAMERKVNPNTVDKAYAELERQGVITIYFKKGAYVERKAKQAESDFFFKEQIKNWKENGVKKEQLEKIIEEVYAQKEEKV